jgi:hypothetical protein
MAQSPLITRRDILNHGASSDFLSQFLVRSIEVQVQTGGALGVMTVAWRFQGATTWSVVEGSVAGAEWIFEVPDPGFADVTFPAHTYTEGSTYTIDPAGNVIPQGSATVGPTAERSDVVGAVIDAVTSDVVTWTQPRVVAPIVSLGEGQKGWAAALAFYRLKSRQGMMPNQAGTGDENLRARALDAETNFKAIGASNNRPPDLIDSSAGGGTAGAGFQMPVSRSSRGFGDFS